MSKFDKVEKVLKFRDNGPSVEEARKAMLASGEAPVGLTHKPLVAQEVPAPASPVTSVPEVQEVLEPGFEEEEIPAVAVAPVAAPAAPTRQAPKAERVETDKFIGEIKQEGGKWVAELQYKNGAGTERFIANSKNDLMLELLRGKGHATLRVREAVRREKLGAPSDLDKYYPLPEGFTSEEFTALPEKQQDAMLYSIASEQVLMFRDAHPEYKVSSENGSMIKDFLNKHKLPITLRNLEYAFEDLQENGQLNVPQPVRTVETILEPAAPAPARTDSAPVVTQPAAVLTAAAPAVPAGVTVRKRGTTGLQPGQSSAPTELGRPPEDGGGQRQLSEAELRKLSPIGQPVSKQLRDLAIAERTAQRQSR